MGNIASDKSIIIKNMTKNQGIIFPSVVIKSVCSY